MQSSTAIRTPSRARFERRPPPTSTRAIDSDRILEIIRADVQRELPAGSRVEGVRWSLGGVMVDVSEPNVIAPHS